MTTTPKHSVEKNLHDRIWDRVQHKYPLFHEFIVNGNRYDDEWVDKFEKLDVYVFELIKKNPLYLNAQIHINYEKLDVAESLGLFSMMHCLENNKEEIEDFIRFLKL